MRSSHSSVVGNVVTGQSCDNWGLCNLGSEMWSIFSMWSNQSLIWSIWSTQFGDSLLRSMSFKPRFDQNKDLNFCNLYFIISQNNARFTIIQIIQNMSTGFFSQGSNCFRYRKSTPHFFIWPSTSPYDHHPSLTSKHSSLQNSRKRQGQSDPHFFGTIQAPSTQTSYIVVWNKNEQ